MNGRPAPAGRRLAAAAVTTTALASVVFTAVPANAASGLGYDATGDKGSLNNIAQVVGAQAAYAAGYTGKGVGVALIDTGVSPVPGLTSGNVVNGPDLSFDSQDPSTAHVDGFGHGTHLASIIAGRDVAGTPASYLDPSRYTGVAPDANLVNVKVGASNGDVDVSQVIAAIDWVVQHRKDEALNIRVINLSYGTDSVQSSMVDPLAYAVENAWRNGIVVVAAGGNEGDTTTNLANPASDPHVLAVGAMDSAGTDSTTDDTVPSWSTDGTDQRHVDLTAPGVSVLGLRVPGGTADSEHPQARVGDRFARASGTSMAAAVVSGEAALLFQAKPDLTPDQVKQILTGSANGLNNVSTLLEGAGTTDLRKALKAVPKTVVDPAPWGTGTGSLEAARGNFHVVVGDATTGETTLSGEVDVFGQAWDAGTWAKLSKDRKAWHDGDWRGATLTAKGWKDVGGGRKAWVTASWSTPGTAVADGDWSARMWRDGTWSARMWRDSMWSARMWRGGFTSAGWF
ncbi:S8 family serine peptidase [Modestobacter excelsi]|uniref:S8 family serine peptidase n=1 Tax=Modestobacter excelsi TaxID=2213161 RepID=UPI001C20EBFA|nr:S8 family serine peptidase [Modestobacter excelsi]